ncbi:helix-turn-helix domain-containing protein [Acidovorax citrulli]|nr:helix-turn-helix domain-containing protein [Paracidovorax citrulli]
MQSFDTITPVKTIAERLRAARERAGLTQPALAQRANVSQGTIGNIESGLRKRPRDLLAIAAALHVSPLWLETGQGLMHGDHDQANVSTAPASMRPRRYPVISSSAGGRMGGDRGPVLTRGCGGLAGQSCGSRAERVCAEAGGQFNDQPRRW